MVLLLPLVLRLGLTARLMTAPQDLPGFVDDLVRFRESMTRRLMREPALSDDVANPLWQARNLVDRALQELVRRYGDPR